MRSSRARPPAPARYPEDPKGRNGAQGQWEIPLEALGSFPHSGEHYASDKWGDTRMGIGFGRASTSTGAWVAGQSDTGAWTPGLARDRLPRAARRSAATDWFRDVDEPQLVRDRPRRQSTAS